jgi:benzoate-CoA ligase family protein
MNSAPLLRLPERLNIASHFLDTPAQNFPGRTAIIGEPLPVTYAELATLSNRFGNSLLSLGCQRGDRILIILPDSAEFIAAFFGAAKIGALAVPVNALARASDYAHYLSDSVPRFVILHSSALSEFAAALVGTPSTTIVLVGDEFADPLGLRCHNWTELLHSTSPDLAAADTLSTDTAFILYTSGSGGIPKGAIHQHKDMLVTAQSFAHGVLNLRQDDITFSVSKLFFAYGLGNGMYFPFSVGARTLLNPGRTKLDTVISMVARHRPSVFFSVPTFYAALLAEAEQNPAVDFSSVRLAVSAGETLPAEIFERFRRRFGLEILDGIGSTEMLHMFLSSRPGKARAGSCGSPTPGYEARIVDEQGSDLPEREIGNLWVRGDSAFAGYWQKPELTSLVKREDWVATGDKFIREDGYYRYCGRSDDMMKVSGMWVSPMEIENALLGHPLVLEAAAVAHTDANGLTHPIAFVVLRTGAANTAHLHHEISEHAKSRLVPYKCPREIRICAELPKTATGKIQRFKLRSPES